MNPQKEKVAELFKKIKIMVINAEPSESSFESGGLWDEICKLCDEGVLVSEPKKEAGMKPEPIEIARECLKGVNFIDDDYDEEHRERAILKVEAAIRAERERLLKAVPSEFGHAFKNQNYVDGWHACRAEILKRIESLT